MMMNHILVQGWNFANILPILYTIIYCCSVRKFLRPDCHPKNNYKHFSKMLRKKPLNAIAI